MEETFGDINSLWKWWTWGVGSVWVYLGQCMSLILLCRLVTVYKQARQLTTVITGYSTPLITSSSSSTLNSVSIPNLTAITKIPIFLLKTGSLSKPVLSSTTQFIFPYESYKGLTIGHPLLEFYMLSFICFPNIQSL